MKGVFQRPGVTAWLWLVFHLYWNVLRFSVSWAQVYLMFWL